MYVKDFFKEQKRHRLSDTERFSLFEEILQHQYTHQKNLIVRAHKIKLKAFVGAFTIAVFSLVFYGTYYDNYIDIDNGYSVTSTNNQDVFADNIGTIVNAEGYFEIINNGRKIIADKISDNDIITLNKDSSLGIRISSTIQAKIIGPAKFSVHFVGQKDNVNQYRIKMIEGDFVAIHGITSDADKEELEIETTDGVVIKQEKTDKKEQISFVVTRKENKSVVLNKGTSTLSVTQQDGETLTEITEITDNTVTMIDTQNHTSETASLTPTTSGQVTNNEETIILTELKDIIAEAEQQYEQIAATSGAVVSGTIVATTPPQPVVKKTASPDAKVINGKIVLTKEETLTLKKNTEGTFLMNDIKKIVSFYLLGQEKKLQVSRGQILGRLDRLYKAIGSENPYRNNDIDTLIASIDTLLDTLRTSYVVSSDVLRNIGVYKNWLIEIQKHQFGTLEKAEDTTFEALVTQENIPVTNTYLNFH